MATKYTVSERTRWQHEHDVRLSDHAIDRYDDRTPPGAVSPETAFEASKPAGCIRHAREFKRLVSTHDNRPDRHEPPDEVRLYCGYTPRGERYTAIFIIRSSGGDTVVTSVYPLAFIRDNRVKSYLNAITRQFPDANAGDPQPDS